MYNELDNNEIPTKTKIKIIALMTMVAVAIVVVVAGTVNVQRNAAIADTELAKTQAANVETVKTSFPNYRDSKQFKEHAKMAMTKISVESLPATITAGLDETVSPNPNVRVDALGEAGNWILKKGGVGIASSFNPNDWSVAEGGDVSIPASAEYGKYTVEIDTGESSPDPENDPGYLVNYYTFKITPPCPTGVTLTHVDH